MILINKKNYWVKIKYLDNIFKNILFKNREKIYQIFQKNIYLNKSYTLIDIGTSPILEESENVILKKYKWK